MNNTFIFVASLIFAIQLGRYFLTAGLAYYFLWVRNKKKYLPRKIQPQPFSRQQINREIVNSVRFSVISGIAFGIPFFGPLAPYSKLYTNASDHSILWFWLTIPTLILIHDTYFYWMHRAIHHPKLYNFVHKVHHESKDPTPFSAYSFHWSEGILEVAWFIPLMFVVPLHNGLLFAFGMISLAYNVNGHLGVELFPQSWKTNSVFKWLNTSTNHNDHHKYYKGNYSFYFSFWDRLMKTQTKLPANIGTRRAA